MKMITADDIRNIQKEQKKSNLEETILKDIQEFARNSKNTTYTKWIYNHDDYLDYQDIEMLKEAGFEVECKTHEDDWRYSICDCQELTISWSE